MAGDDFAETPGGNCENLSAPHSDRDPLYHSFNHSQVTEHYAALHMGRGIFADYALRKVEVYTVQLSGFAEKIGGAGHQSGRNRPADVISILIQDIKSRGRAQIYYDARTGIICRGGYGVAEPVGADFSRIIDQDAPPEIQITAYDQSFTFKKCARHNAKRLRQARHYRANYDSANSRRIEVIFIKPGFDYLSISINQTGWTAVNPQNRLDDITFKRPDRHICITNINSQKHFHLSFTTVTSAA
jgi:hypothetical protein